MKQSVKSGISLSKPKEIYTSPGNETLNVTKDVTSSRVEILLK